MKNMTLPQVAKAVNGKLYIDGKEYAAESIKGQNSADLRLLTEADGIVIDSRLCRENYIFAAVKGERTDGHNYMQSVLAKGALGCICEKLPDGYFDTKEAEDETDLDRGPEALCIHGAYILVENTLKALKELAAYYRQKP